MATGFIKHDASPIIFIFIIFAVVNLSLCSKTENELLTARVDNLQSKLDQLITQLEEEKIHRSNLQIQNSKLETRIDQQDEEIRFLKNNIMNNDDQLNKPKSLKNDASSDDLRNAGVKSDISPRLPPSSCRQLSTIGHYLDGIYLVANPDTNKMETVYCEFGSSTLSETLFGSLEVKSKSVIFYVQRSTNFALENVVLPFDIEVLNIGGAMNTATGVFTAPVNGIYHFEFSALKDAFDEKYVWFNLQVNGVGIGSSFASSGPMYLGLSGINAYLQLKAGDQVSLFKTFGTLNDGNRDTHFTGWLVEEDILFG